MNQPAKRQAGTGAKRRSDAAIAAKREVGSSKLEVRAKPGRRSAGSTKFQLPTSNFGGASGTNYQLPTTNYSGGAPSDPAAAAARFSPPPRFTWPAGHRCAAMLCFDVDGETTALSEDPALGRRRTLMSQCEYGPRVGVPRLLGLLDHLQVPATFFVPGYIAEQHPKMVQAIVERGHEVGLHGYLHEKLAQLTEAEEEAILVRCIDLLERLTGTRPVGYRAPWFENNPWTADLLHRHGLRYNASEMGDDVPYRHSNGLVEIPGQWMLEDWEQFAFNAEPAWGFVPENCAKVYDLWWREFEAMHAYGCCFVLTLHPWLSGRPSRVQLLEDLVRAMQAKTGVWFARGREIAAHVAAHPQARREIDFDQLPTP